MEWEKQLKVVQAFGPLYPHGGRAGWSSWLQPGCCSHLGNSLVDGRSLSLSFCLSLSPCNSLGGGRERIFKKMQVKLFMIWQPNKLHSYYKEENHATIWGKFWKTLKAAECEIIVTYALQQCKNQTHMWSRMKTKHGQILCFLCWNWGTTSISSLLCRMLVITGAKPPPGSQEGQGKVLCWSQPVSLRRLWAWTL